MSNGWPEMKFVAVDEKNSWPSDGARNPVLTAPRRANRRTGSNRAESLPVDVEPKSL
jgi:hypothetical protein